MGIPSYLKRLIVKRLSTVVILRRRIAMRRLQQIAVELHVKYLRRAKIMNINSIASNLNDHYEFSCSSSPSTKSSISGNGVNSGSGRNNSYGRFLLRALLPSCTRLDVKDDLDSESGNDDIPHFIACDEDDDHLHTEHQFSVNSDSNESASDPFTSVSATTCSNCCLSSEIDRQAEEFIATFYKQLRLERQDSYVKCQEMLARGSS